MTYGDPSESSDNKVLRNLSHLGGLLAEVRLYSTINVEYLAVYKIRCA